MNALTHRPPVPSRTVLTRLPFKVLRFLRTIGINSEINRAMKRAGFSSSDSIEGWRLLAAACSSEIAVNLDMAQLHQQLVELHRWYWNWSNVARTCITRRDWLIPLGLASRRAIGPRPDSVSLQAC